MPSVFCTNFAAAALGIRTAADGRPPRALFRAIFLKIPKRCKKQRSCRGARPRYSLPYTVTKSAFSHYTPKGRAPQIFGGIFAAFGKTPRQSRPRLRATPEKPTPRSLLPCAALCLPPRLICAALCLPLALFAPRFICAPAMHCSSCHKRCSAAVKDVAAVPAQTPIGTALCLRPCHAPPALA